MLDKLAIARALREVGHLLQLKGENPFKVRAYETGARAIEELPDDLGARVAAGTLTEVSGIGEALSKKIAELHLTGKLALLEKLREELPPGIVELSRVPDLGPKKVAALREALGISSVEELRKACEDGRLRGVKGFGEKTEQKILEGIARMASHPERVLLAAALDQAEPLLAHLRRCPAVVRAELAGSARRWRETVADLDFVATSDAPAEVMDHFARWPAVERVEGRGDTKMTVHLGGGLHADLRVLPDADFATALHHFTGSEAHHVKLRGLARDKGLTVSEWGVFTLEGEVKLPIASEEELYAKLGLPFIPPELREDEGELEAGLAGRRFDDLVTLDDVAGMTHCHTVFSDGQHTVEEMAREAERMGMRYLTITDHSPTASYAGGVTLDRLKAQWDEIDRVQELVKVKLLKGTESDILDSGLLDYPDAVLEQLDVVIASVHNRYKMDEAAMTKRIVTAMKLPVFKIWGHALGRLIGSRPPFDCRVEEVLDAVAASRAAVEVNGNPHRLELEPRWIREARKRGLRFVLSTDAHSTRELHNLRFAVHTARRGGLRRGEVLNALPAEEFARAVKPAA